jgi:HNH endonuclease/AP2 domain
MAVANPTSTNDLAPHELREALAYDPDTGRLTWLTRPLRHFKDARAQASWNTRFAGKTTGHALDKNGYPRVNIRGTPHLAHRLAWAIVHGKLPAQLDHINGNPADMRLCNLRACAGAENQHNRPRSKNNSSGFKGVCWHAQCKKWRAYIVINWKQKHLGLFDTAIEAHEAFCKAADEMHGAFANYGLKASATD